MTLLTSFAHLFFQFLGIIQYSLYVYKFLHFSYSLTNIRMDLFLQKMLDEFTEVFVRNNILNY